MTPTAADVSHSAVCDHDLLRKVKDLEVVYEGTWQLENIDERIQISITALDALEPSAVPHEQLAIASSEELTNETGTQKRTIGSVHARLRKSTVRLTLTFSLPVN